MNLQPQTLRFLLALGEEREEASCGLKVKNIGGGRDCMVEATILPPAIAGKFLSDADPQYEWMAFEFNDNIMNGNFFGDGWEFHSIIKGRPYRTSSTGNLTEKKRKYFLMKRRNNGAFANMSKELVQLREQVEQMKKDAAATVELRAQIDRLSKKAMEDAAVIAELESRLKGEPK